MIDNQKRIESLQQTLATMRVNPVLSYAEIARLLNCSLGQVTGYLHRAKQCLENVLNSRKTDR